MAVTFDVLRATTTLVHAFAHGALEVRAFASPEAARAEAVRPHSAGSLLCGERAGLRVEGFDLGNSPAEYVGRAVAGRRLLFASTNGAPALVATAGARHQILAAFVNLGAAVERCLALLAHEPSLSDEAWGGDEIWLVCAGKDGAPSAEDAACAAAFLDRLAIRLEERGGALDAAEAGAVLRPYRLPPRGDLFTFLAATEHGRELAGLGPAFVDDLRAAAALDVLSAVPEGRGGVLGPGPGA